MVQRRKNRSYLLPWLLSIGVGILVATPIADLVARVAGDRFAMAWAVTFWFLGGVISAATFITHELIREERATSHTRRRVSRLKTHAHAA